MISSLVPLVDGNEDDFGRSLDPGVLNLGFEEVTCEIWPQDRTHGHQKYLGFFVGVSLYIWRSEAFTIIRNFLVIFVFFDDNSLEWGDNKVSKLLVKIDIGKGMVTYIYMY